MPLPPIPTGFLNTACQEADLRNVQMFLACGVKPDAQTLTLACASRSLGIVRAVLDAGAAPDDKTWKEAQATKHRKIITLVKQRLSRTEGSNSHPVLSYKPFYSTSKESSVFTPSLFSSPEFTRMHHQLQSLSKTAQTSFCSSSNVYPQTDSVLANLAIASGVLPSPTTSTSFSAKQTDRIQDQIVGIALCSRAFNARDIVHRALHLGYQPTAQNLASAVMHEINFSVVETLLATGIRIASDPTVDPCLLFNKAIRNQYPITTIQGLIHAGARVNDCTLPTILDPSLHSIPGKRLELVILAMNLGARPSAKLLQEVQQTIANARQQLVDFETIREWIKISHVLEEMYRLGNAVLVGNG